MVPSKQCHCFMYFLYLAYASPTHLEYISNAPRLYVPSWSPKFMPYVPQVGFTSPPVLLALQRPIYNPSSLPCVEAFPSSLLGLHHPPLLASRGKDRDLKCIGKVPQGLVSAATLNQAWDLPFRFHLVACVATASLIPTAGHNYHVLLA